jgi:putative restriction endonuclease
MKIWVGVTDEQWFDRLSLLKPDEVNFWQPSGGRRFAALASGEPFLFKLHSPKNFIVGGGHFVRHSPLPASLSWDAFGEKNGVGSYRELLARVRRYRRQDDSVDPVIGCNVLAEPFFLPPAQWIPVPASWAPNIVQGKTYDSTTTEGAALWRAVRQALARDTGVADAAKEPLEIEGDRFGSEYLTRTRLGQGAFRVLVIDAYQRRCAVTGEKTLPVLEAVHIRPYASQGPHRVSNGILLRSDLHKLFDVGYVTVTPDLKLEVSPRLREEWHNGREYYAHHGEKLNFMPADPSNRPSTEFLGWHNEEVFKT